MPVEEGLSPVSSELREGLHSGAWQCALVNSVPRAASCVDVRRLHLRMPFQRADPIVLIIDGDEEHIRLGGQERRAKGKEAEQREAKHGAHNDRFRQGFQTML